MCSIFGWLGDAPIEIKKHLIQTGSLRGRDGYGMQSATRVVKRVGKLQEEDILEMIHDSRVVGNFRATPTTEEETREEYLQPYEGIVHNGTVANCDEYGTFPVDSMALPEILKDRFRTDDMGGMISKIQGGYAIAWIHGHELVLANNYKPIYFCTGINWIAFASIPEMFPPGFLPQKLPPYSFMRSTRWNRAIYPLFKKRERGPVLIAASGGMDSTVAAYDLKSRGYDPILVHFKYGCNAQEREREAIRRIAEHGSFEVVEVDLPKVFSGSIVEGDFNKDEKRGVRYAEDWVSARNLLILSTLTAMAESREIHFIAYGGNLEEGGGYPDNEEEFARMFNQLLPYAVQANYQLDLLHPLSRMMKHEIVSLGLVLGVPFVYTWSCYSDQEEHCGTCSPCYMRRRAFERNGTTDPCQPSKG